ncbi:MAG: hypothetical protein ABIK28_07735 [Planctomycetota bacterium]
MGKIAFDLLLNTQLFANFLGVLNSMGQAQATLNASPLDPMYAGLRMYYGYCLGWPRRVRFQSRGGDRC